MIPKFRAYAKEANKTYEITEIDFGDEQLKTELGDWWSFGEVEIMQSTGLKDKNGVEIFEGDIGWDDHQEVHGQVIFENGAFKYEWDNISEDLFEATDDIEIVGNIYENSELLEGTE
ncbi:YopX family protein [Enterococcus faecalis]